MSKRIPYVPDIHREAPGDEKYYLIPGVEVPVTSPTRLVRKADGSSEEVPNAPWTIRQIGFLLERIADAKFVEGKEAIEGELLRDDVRGIIKRQRDDAPRLGYWLLDNDDHYIRILNATVKPITPLQPPALAFNYVPFIRAVMGATTPAAEIELPPVTNGVAAQAS
jgi:hypothetical protein